MLKKITTITITAIILCSCVINQSPSYVEEYGDIESEKSLVNIPEQSIKNFVNLFNDIHSENLAHKLDMTYAKKFYFNDTLNTIKSRKDMLSYLEHTANNLDKYQLNIIDHSQSGDNLYIRWTMNMQFSAFGKEIKSQSIGMSHLKFNVDGKIILHQDYWDSVEAIYQHLPFLGYWVKKVRSKL